jgi:hypothetical protein
MNNVVRLALNTTPQQAQRLLALQHAFADVCNALGPLVQQTRCWNRVALHHMAYKQLRQQFPGLGSQMVCNAIYSVSRACRVVYQHPQSPFSLARLGDKPLPRLQFLAESPVYFDRHTLSIKDGQVSMFTLDGRMRFQLNLSPEDEHRFRTEKLREIVLDAKAGIFRLAFFFAQEAPASSVLPPRSEDDEAENGAPNGGTEMPEYVVVIEDPVPLQPPLQQNHQAFSLPT